ncbi:hypothetical protein GCM10009789_37050 [Kribbella sancticallisti]|uniref:HTH araC/xylS-type domain-containing protein n=1 Tax=Kribbella sancticallisti TaxID=460087 RepID=A0ABN2DNT3_9ACTN
MVGYYEYDAWHRGKVVDNRARLCGFGTAIAMRQHFAKHIRTSPMAYRRTFRAAN